MTNEVYLHRNKQVLADDAAQAAREAFGKDTAQPISDVSRETA